MYIFKKMDHFWIDVAICQVLVLSVASMMNNADRLEYITCLTVLLMPELLHKQK